MISNALYTKDYPFLGDYPDKGDVMTNWPYINPAVIAAAIPEQVFDLHCMKYCTANDGNVYEQPHSAYDELTDAGYFMFDFEQKLPWDMLFNGNVGTRYVTTATNSTGFMTLAHTAVTPAYNPVTNPGAVVTTTVAMNTSIKGDDSRLAAGLQLQSLGLARAAGAPLLQRRSDVAPAAGLSAALGNLHHRRTQYCRRQWDRRQSEHLFRPRRQSGLAAVPG